MTRRIMWPMLVLALLIATPGAAQTGSEAQGQSPVQLVHESRQAVGAGRLDQALDKAGAAVAADPAYAAAWKQQGRVLMLRGDHAQALESFSTALELEPQDTEIRGWIPQLMLALGHIDSMIGVLNSLSAAELDRLGAQWFADTVNHLLQRGDAGSAARVIERLARVSEHRAPALVAGVLDDLAAGDPDAARRRLSARDAGSEAGQWRALIAAAWSGLGRAYLDADRAASAIAALEEALRLRPQWIPALRDLGWAWRRDGQPARAAETWQSGVERVTDDGAWWLWIAEAQFDADAPAAAARAAARVLDREPGQRRAQVIRLAALMQAGDAAAESAMQEALAAGPSGQRIVALSRAMVARAAGRYAEAAEALEPLHREAPDDSELTRLLAQVYSEWAGASRDEDTIKPLEKLTALDPGRAGAWRDLGWGYWVAGRDDDALDAWDRAMREGVAQRERLATQVAARLVEQGRVQQAIATYRQWFPDTGLLPLGRRLLDAGLVRAAEPILLAAWERGEDRFEVGLELGYAEARAGVCFALNERFDEVVSRIDELSPGRVDKLLEALAACASDPGIQPLIESVQAELGSRPVYQARLADLLLQAAASRAQMPEREKALELYREALNTDPDRPGVWLRAANLAESLGREDELRGLLADVAARSASTAVRRGIEGYQAARDGRLAEAAAHYRQSLDDEPQQPALRMALFETLLTLERYPEAREEADWFVQRLHEGDASMRSYVAEVGQALGDDPDALQHWEALYLGSPQTAYYGVEAARAMYELCRADDARLLLEQITAFAPEPRAYELLAEMALAQGRPGDALRWTRVGLEHGRSNGLLRMRAEAAEAAGRPDTAREAAEALLARDPGNVAIARLLGRAMLMQGERQAAEAHFSSLLDRNEQFVPALSRLRESASQRGETGTAAELAARLAAQRPWDASARRGYGTALAEDREFEAALPVLRNEADRYGDEVVPVLVYSGVSACDYPGRTSAGQVAAHIERLAAEGYEFADPEALVGDSGEASGVLLVVAGASAEALERIDAALAESGGRAVYAATGLERSRPDVRAIIDSGRWIPASAGPADSHRRTIDEQGLRGNPLTHSLHRSGDREEPADMRQRLDETMQQAASFEPGDGPRVLLYPGGDYGQLSLDTDERALEALRAGVARHFDLALAGDDHGFATPGDEDFDPLRVPARVVPAAWDGDALIDHLRHRHPVAQGRLQLAKALFWNAQHERADYRFAQAEAAGADRGEVLHHSGANAYREGDLASALERLRAASRLDPGNARIDAALEAAEWRRRPQLELDLSAWDDSDDRSFDRQGASVGGHLTDHLRLELFADNNRWQRDGTGEEEGLRLGLGGRWYFAEGHWLDGRLWRMDLDDVDNHTGGELNVHLPVPAWSGAVDAYARREQIETVEAVRGELLQEQLGLSLHTRIRDMWDLYADPRYIRRSDDNDGWMVEGRLVRRLAEWPFLGVGYRLRLGDSDRDPPEYWAPESLRQHQLYATWRGDHGPLYYNLSTEVGYARETATDWRFVWGGRARLEYAIGRRVSVTGELNRLETPDYDRTGLMLGVDLQF